MKRLLISLAVASLGLVPAVALADTATSKVDSDHSATGATATQGANRDLLTPEDILAIVKNSHPAGLVVPDPTVPAAPKAN